MRNDISYIYEIEKTQFQLWFKNRAPNQFSKTKSVKKGRYDAPCYDGFPEGNGNGSALLANSSNAGNVTRVDQEHKPCPVYLNIDLPFDSFHHSQPDTPTTPTLPTPKFWQSGNDANLKVLEIVSFDAASNPPAIHPIDFPPHATAEQPERPKEFEMPKVKEEEILSHKALLPSSFWDPPAPPPPAVFPQELREQLNEVPHPGDACRGVSYQYLLEHASVAATVQQGNAVDIRYG